MCGHKQSPGPEELLLEKERMGLEIPYGWGIQMNACVPAGP